MFGHWAISCTHLSPLELTLLSAICVSCGSCCWKRPQACRLARRARSASLRRADVRQLVPCLSRVFYLVNACACVACSPPLTTAEKAVLGVWQTSMSFFYIQQHKYQSPVRKRCFERRWWCLIPGQIGCGPPLRSIMGGSAYDIIVYCC